MGEAPRGRPVPRPRREVADIATSEDEPENVRAHRRAAVVKPSSSAIDSDSDEGSEESDDTKCSVTTLTTVTTAAGMESSESSEDETFRADGSALANPQGKLSFSGRGSKASMSNRGGGLVKLQGQQQRSPPKETDGKNKKAARIAAGPGEAHGDDDEARKKTKRNSIRVKSLHRAKIAKEYSTSESEDDVPVRPLSSSHSHHLDTITSSSILHSTSGKFAGPRSHAVEKDDRHASSDSDSSSIEYDSDDEEDEHKDKRMRIHSRGPSLHAVPAPKPTRAIKFAYDEEMIPAQFSGRDYSRSDAESHDADHERWEEEEDDYEDTRGRRLRGRNQGNSASFSGAVSRNFRWSNVKTKIFYSFRAKGSDDEGSRVICVKNLAPTVNEQILLDFFAGIGRGAIVNITTDEFGRCSGTAYLEFESAAAARKALQKGGTKLLERVVFVDVAHETSTTRHTEARAAPVKPAEPPPPAPTGGGLDIHSIFPLSLIPFHRDKDSDESVRKRAHEKSNESLQPLKGARGVSGSGGPTSPRDSNIAINELLPSVHDPEESSRGKTALGAFRQKLFGSSKSGSGSNSEKIASQNQSRGAETQSRGIEIQSRGLDFLPRGFNASQSGPSPGMVIDEAPGGGFMPLPREHNKKKRWSWGQFRRKHRWAKLLWPWGRKPRWHWWHFANLSARWGKASRSPQVKTMASLPREASTATSSNNESSNCKSPRSPCAPPAAAPTAPVPLAL
ncbi:hypothetical protein MPTK1_3g22540 [Marchantia polymorpha subsp. ruderalis]|uniref:RRM domain-containing protein n=2 Tax=Marchantia polymorpha TaxID=3197 RepID=A0AAF6B3N0_MARPO|nr:hypothetical protein MARPO_0024s0032 [Marchantia polymorpha]BBN06614.1 hypothetical protein Mp_3g22540 [Marchantia polymorpha subsp. ruderalis]|eukprot:PTQ43514.1 hypothetical protein MARPO_0024s0032 [Marchantia polymorpha]